MNADELWQNLVNSYEAYIRAREAVFVNMSSSERVQLVGKSLHHPDTSPAAVAFAREMSVEERKQLLWDLVGLGSGFYGQTKYAHEVILSLPHDWLRENIEPIVDKVLEKGSEEEYRLMLSLYSKVDRTLTRKLAERAIQSQDDLIRDAGETYLEKLNRSPNAD